MAPDRRRISRRPSLKGTIQPLPGSGTPWDPALAEAMRHRCERVSEEARLARLLNDLNGNLRDDKIGDGGQPAAISAPVEGEV